MIRSSFSALLGAAFGAVAIHPIRERCLDAGLANPELSAVGFTAGVAALIWLLLMTCREPAALARPIAEPHAEHQVHVHVAHPTPPTDGSCAKLQGCRVAEARRTRDHSDVSYTDLERCSLSCRFIRVGEPAYRP